MSFRKQLIFTVALIYFICNAVFIYFFISNKKKESLEQLEFKINNFSVLMNQVNAWPLYDMDREMLETNLLSFYHDPDIASISLKEINGDISISYDEKGMDSEDLIINTTGLYYHSEKIGVITVIYTKENINERINRYIRELVFFFVILTIIISLVLYFSMRSIVKPVVDLTRLSEEIANGNLDKEIDIKSHNEIGRLANSFLKMRDSIKQKIESLHIENEEKMKAQAALCESETRYRTLFESAAEGIILLKEDKFVDFNEKVLELFNTTPEELLKARFSDFFSNSFDEEDKSKEFFRKKIHNVLNGEALLFDWKLKKKNGKDFEAEIGLNLVELDTGKYIQAIVRDVSEKKIILEQLNHKGKMDAIGQLAGGIAHDFNNMLTGIIGAAQLLKYKRIKQDDDCARFIDIILKTSFRAAELTSKLLTFGRKGKYTSTEVDVHKIIDDTVIILERTLDKKIKINVHKKAQAAKVIGDNSALQNALLNIGINAGQAMPDGGTLTITTDVVFLNCLYCKKCSFNIKEGDFISIRMTDTGVGIAPECLKKIFEPFFTTKEQGQGTGLGLSTVYGTARDHHGAVKVYSEPGRGTSFVMYVPLSLPTEGKPRKNREIVMGKGLILFIDDEEFIRVTGKYILEEMGYEVLLAANGEEGLKQFDEHGDEIDLVLLDMVMPEMNGKEVFYRLREKDPVCKIIMSSGFTKDESIRDLKKDGLAGFVTKPYRDYELSVLIADTLGLK